MCPYCAYRKRTHSCGQAGIALLREAAEGHKQVLGEEHPDTIDAFASMAEQEATALSMLGQTNA